MYVKKVAVVGSGTMGADIAYVIALAGIPVLLRDVAEEPLARARAHIQELFDGRVARGRMTASDARDRLEQLSYSTDVADLADVSLAIEAVTEHLPVKKAVFQELDRYLPSLSLIVTNTSALGISELARITGRPERVAGFHFFYPAHMMKLVEVVAGETTSEETMDTLVRFAEEIRKISVRVRECPGFVVNRVLMAVMAEVMRLRRETGMSPEAIDAVVMKHRLAPMGPFVLGDALGLDVALEVAHTLQEAYGDRFDIGSELPALVAAGHLGLKSGHGFYHYA